MNINAFHFLFCNIFIIYVTFQKLLSSEFKVKKYHKEYHKEHHKKYHKKCHKEYHKEYHKEHHKEYHNGVGLGLSVGVGVSLSVGAGVSLSVGVGVGLAVGVGVAPVQFFGTPYLEHAWCTNSAVPKSSFI